MECKVKTYVLCAFLILSSTLTHAQQQIRGQVEFSPQWEIRLSAWPIVQTGIHATQWPDTVRVYSEAAIVYRPTEKQELWLKGGAYFHKLTFFQSLPNDYINANIRDEHYYVEAKYGYAPIPYIQLGFGVFLWHSHTLEHYSSRWVDPVINPYRSWDFGAQVSATAILPIKDRHVYIEGNFMHITTSSPTIQYFAYTPRQGYLGFVKPSISVWVPIALPKRERPD